MALIRSLERARVISKHLATRMCSSRVEDVLLQQVKDKGLITLNRTRALNALTLSMIRQIHPKLMEWQSDPGISMVIIKGAGPKAFCAGGDVVALAEAGKKDEPLKDRFMREEYALNYAIGTCSVPYVALIDGITMGGGVGLSVHGQFRVATEKTMFAMPETAIGLFPDVGGGYFLPRLHGQLGTFLALTGHRLKGSDILMSGVATHFVESSMIGDLENELLSLQSTSSATVEKVLSHYQSKSASSLEKPFSLESLQDKIDSLFGGNSLEEICAQLEKDGSEWALKHLATLRKMSPISLKITLRQVREGASLDLADVLRMEYRLCQRCLEDKDFYEGVRAVLVDKDQNPMWDPPTLEQVSQAKVDSYFSQLPPERELKL